MRRLLLALCLPLLMLLAQQGALAHEIGHLQAAGSGNVDAGTGKQVAADTLCLSCLAHADLSGLAQATGPCLRLGDFAHALRSTPDGSAALAQRLAARSRGPPSFL